MREDIVTNDEVKVNGIRYAIRVEETWCPGDRCWVPTAATKVGGKTLYATGDYYEDAVQLLVSKIKAQG